MKNDTLCHYGVLGMRWGIHRTPEQLGHKKEKKVKRKKNKILDKNTIKQRSIKDMSDDELRRAINRIQLEREYSRLHPAQVSRGKAIYDRVLKNMVIPAAEDVGKQLIKSQITKLVNEKLNLEDEYKVHTNNRKK